MRTDPITIRFPPDEAELVAEALHRYQPEAPADRMKVARMRDLIDTELGKGKR